MTARSRLSRLAERVETCLADGNPTDFVLFAIVVWLVGTLAALWIMGGAS